MMVQGERRDSLPCEGEKHAILGLDGVVDEDLLMRMLSRNGVNIAGTKAFDYLLSKLKGPENSDANEEFDVESLADLEFLNDIDKRQDFQNSIEKLLKDFGDLDSLDGDQASDGPPTDSSDTPTRLSRRPSLHPSRYARPSMPHRHQEVEHEADLKSPHSHLLKILEGVVKDVQTEAGDNSNGKKKRSISKPKQRTHTERDRVREKDHGPRARRKSMGRAAERGSSSDMKHPNSRAAEKAREERFHRRSSHTKTPLLEASRWKESSSSHRPRRDSAHESGSSSRHGCKSQTARGSRQDSDSHSEDQPPIENRKQSSSHHRSSSQHSVSSRSSSRNDSGRESPTKCKERSRGSVSTFNSPSGQRKPKAKELPLRTPLSKEKGRALIHPSSPETAVTYEFDQEESESSFACSSYRASPSQSRGRGASSTVSRRGRSRSTSRARMHSTSRHPTVTDSSECSWIPHGALGHEGSSSSHGFEMRDEDIVVATKRNARRCRSVEPSMWRSVIPAAALCEATHGVLSSIELQGDFQVPVQASYSARRRSSMGSTLSCSTPAQRRRSLGSSRIVSMPQAFPSLAHRRGSIDSASINSVQHAAHFSMDRSGLRSLPQAHRRNSIDSVSISSMPPLYGSAAQRRASINGGLIRSPSSMSVSSRVSNSSGLTAHSAPAHLYRSPTGWASPNGSHYPGGVQAYPAIRPPPQLYPSTRRGSFEGSGGFGAGEARRRARADAATDPFFSVSAFGHSSTDPFREARRASLY